MFTMDGWEDAEDLRNDTKGGDYIRLKDGEKALLVFPAAPYAYRQVWLQNEGRSELYDPAKHDGIRPSGRFMFAVLELVGETDYAPKLFEASGETFDAIKKACGKYGMSTLFEVEREGTGTDTKYSVLLERKLEGGELEHVKGLAASSLLDAEAAVLGKGDAESPTTPEGTDPWANKASA